MRYPLGLLHQQGISVLAYLDDRIVWGPSPEETYQSVLKTTELLSNLGSLINKEKSQPVPLPEREWLGIQWFTQSGHWGIPQQKQMELMNVLKRFYTSSTCSRRSWERLIGSLNFVTQILTQFLHLLQPLLRPQLLGSTSTRDQLRPVPDQLRKALIPWMNPLILKQKETFYVDHNPVLLWTDASLTGWGGHTNFSYATGYWNPTEMKLHVNILEIRAVYLTLAQLNLKNKTIHLFIDNAPAQYTSNHANFRIS